jgi:pyruvate dehydrogenase complex dehydrogenase (E1) component
MSALFEVLRRTSRFTTSQPPIPHADLARALFRVGKREQTVQLAQHAATLAALSAKPDAEATSRERAVAALHMYCARAAIEEIEDALVHIDDGTSARELLRSASDRVVVTALRGLAQRGDVDPQFVVAAIEQFGIDIEPNA